MNILHVIGSLEVGGAQRLLLDLIPLLNKNNHVEILTCEYVDNAIVDNLNKLNIHITCLNIKQRNPLVIFKLIFLFKRFDIVHVHLFPLLYWAAFASLFSSAKYIYTEHSTSNRRRNIPIFRNLERFVYSRYDKISSVSGNTPMSLKEWLRSDDERLLVINNGVDLNRFISSQKGERKNQIVMISRFAPSKDHKTLIRAMKNVDSDLQLALVGSGALINECKEFALSFGVLDRVHFLGEREDVSDVISESLIGVQSSKWEGFGLTVIEMMAGGLPVIASNVDGMSQIVEGAGILFEIGNDEELSEQINKLFKNKDYYLRIRMYIKHLQYMITGLLNAD